MQDKVARSGEDELQLSGWTRKRRVVVLRRPLRSELHGRRTGTAEGNEKPAKQLTLDLPETDVSGSAL